MASAGRILIMPKGNYDPSVTYEMLDLVKHSSTAWLAKKTCTGIEPSEANSEYWHKLVDLDWDVDSIGAIKRSGYLYYDGNVDELKDAGTYHVVTPNDKVTGTLPMPDGYWYTINVFADGTGSVVQIWVVATAAGTPSRIFMRHYGGSSWYPYFELVNANNGAFASDVTLQKANNGKSLISKNHSDSADFGTELIDYDGAGNKLRLSVTSNVNLMDTIGITKNDGDYMRLFGEHNTDLLLSLISGSLSGVKFATGTYTGTGDTNTKTLSFDFAPKVLIIIGLAANGVNSTSTTILIPDTGAGNTTLYSGSLSMGVLAVTKSGNNVTMTDNIGTNLKTYYVCNSASFTYAYLAIG